MKGKLERTNYLEISCSHGESSNSDFYCIIDETALANSRSNHAWYIYYDNTVWFLRYYATTIKITSRQHRPRMWCEWHEWNIEEHTKKNTEGFFHKIIEHIIATSSDFVRLIVYLVYRERFKHHILQLYILWKMFSRSWSKLVRKTKIKRREKTETLDLHRIQFRPDGETIFTIAGSRNCLSAVLLDCYLSL